MIDTMRKRQSIRTYDTKNILESDFIKIKDYIKKDENFKGPFGYQGRVELVQVTNYVTDKGIKLGTYGFIKNQKGYLVGLAENNKDSLLDFAYCFQKLVLYLTDLELGTCWMGGTFNRNSFEQEISIEKGEFIPSITPFGYPNEKQRVFDKVARMVVKADNKKAWDKLFYDTDFTSPLPKEKAGQLEIPIEMVRLGPSASNKQPWRLVLSEDRKVVHFYIEHTPNYSAKLGYCMQLLDIGIAMCQFDIGCQELRIDGEWFKEEPDMMLPNENVEYMVSWKTR